MYPERKHQSSRQCAKLPLVSVVIPVYNVEQYIQEALDSALKQTYRNIEIIVVDDGSPDNSVAIIQKRYNDPRLRIVRQRNRGLAGARNTGIRHASGQYVAFLDSDDFWQPNKIELQIDAMLKNPNYGGFETKDKACDGIPYTQYFDENLSQSEDVDCWTRIAIQTGTDFYYIEQPLTNYRLNNDGLSANVEKQFATWMQLHNKLETIAPGFIQKQGSFAKAFQYRYLARRSVFQGQASNAVKFMWLASKTKPYALIREFRRTLETTVAALLLSCLPKQLQRKLVERLL